MTKLESDMVNVVIEPIRQMLKRLVTPDSVRIWFTMSNFYFGSNLN